MNDRSQAARSAKEETARAGRFALLRRKHEWLDRLVRAAAGYQRQYGDYYAAAITYFSVLALVPLLMIAFAAAGFVLAGDPRLLAELQRSITTAVPDPQTSGLLSGIVEEATSSAGAVGVVGLLVALYSGLGWMTNLREALTAQFSQQPRSESFLRQTAADLLSLIGLGLALILSFGITAAGSTVASWLSAAVGLDSTSAGALLKILSIALAVAADWLVFLWVFARLPRTPVTVRSAVWGALFAALGFEVLKQVAVVYLGSVTGSPSGAAFGPILGLLVFANLASRFVLFVAAWTASARENLELAAPEPPGPAIIRPEVRGGRPRAATALSMLGIGLVMGWGLRRTGHKPQRKTRD